MVKCGHADLRGLRRGEQSHRVQARHQPADGPAMAVAVRSDGLDSVGDVRAGRGRKPAMTERQVQAVVQATVEETPPGAARWSLRSMARAAGVSQSTVQRVWDMHGLQPHRATAFTSSTAPAFVAQLTDVVGLYLSSRDSVAVLSVDERSQVAALDHPQAGPPTRWGSPPKGALWLDLVESWVTRLAQHVDRGGFCSVPELVAAIRDYSRHDDTDAGPVRVEHHPGRPSSKGPPILETLERSR